MYKVNKTTHLAEQIKLIQIHFCAIVRTVKDLMLTVESLVNILETTQNSDVREILETQKDIKFLLRIMMQ